MSLSMQGLEYSPTAIASAATISGLAAIPLTLLIGAVSDHLGKRQSLWLVYLLAASATYMLSESAQLWQFLLAASLTLLAFCTNGAMTSALAADLLPPTGLTRGLSWVNTALSAGAILSFLGTGYLMDLLAPRSLFLITSALPVTAAGIVWLLPSREDIAAEALSTAESESNQGAQGTSRTSTAEITSGCI